MSRIELCSPVANQINNTVIKGLNGVFKYAGIGLNAVSSGIKVFLVTVVSGLDYFIDGSVNILNKGIEGLNSVSGIFPMLLNFIGGLFSDSLFQFIKSTIGIILVYTLPESMFSSIQFYLVIIWIVLITVFIVSPILSFLITLSLLF